MRVEENLIRRELAVQIAAKCLRRNEIFDLATGGWAVRAFEGAGEGRFGENGVTGFAFQSGGSFLADVSTGERRRFAILFAAALTFGACAPTSGQVGGQSPGRTAQASAPAHRDQSSANAMRPGAAEAGMENKTGGNSIKGGALYVLLNDAYVEPVRSTGTAMGNNWSGEIFQSDGIYAQVSGRTRLYGSYHVQGDAVCVKGDGIKQRCRLVISNADGTYSLIDVSTGSSVLVTTKPRHSFNNWLIAGKPPNSIHYKGQRYIKLDGSGVLSTLRNRMLSHVPGSLLSMKYLTEHFSESYYLMTAHDSLHNYGTWSVVEDMVCVRASVKLVSVCRNVYLSKDKVHVLMVEKSGDRRHYALGPAIH